jgi:predicted lactoylglutathione lyase
VISAGTVIDVAAGRDEFQPKRRSARVTREKGATTAMQTFVNLPVEDLARATAFFTALGFSFDPRFTDENATRMIVSDDTSVMLVAEPFFKGFIEPQAVADTTTAREVVVGLSAESREQVDELAGRALAAGGRALGEAQDDGFMYMRGFRDLDGHQWSFVHMDMSAIPG